MQATMNAIVASDYGTADVLELRRVERPVPGNGQVLVKVYAASATRADSMMLSGKPYVGRLVTGMRRPKHAIPGTGFAGEVVAVGEGVRRFASGDRVFGETTIGFSTNAEYVAVNEDGVIVHLPDNLTYGEAAPICDGALTSLLFLKEIANVKPGMRVLINGAAGSLGSAAVQLARLMGADVTGVCGTRNIGLVRSLGADRVLDYTNEDFTQSADTYDVIFDTVGKSSFMKSRRALKNGGKYISPVLSFPLLLQMLGTSLFGSRKAVFAAAGLKKDAELRELVLDLVSMVKNRELKTVIDRQYPLEKTAEAHRYIAAGHKKGNVVVIVNS